MYDTLSQYIADLPPLVFAAIIVTFFVLMGAFLFTGKPDDIGQKIYGFFAMMLGFAAFAVLFLFGMYIGDIMGIGDAGALIGIGLFWVLFSVVAYLRRPKKKEIFKRHRY